jgi:hypothetical protein
VIWLRAAIVPDHKSTAKNLTIPPKLLFTADAVIE